MNKLRLSTAVTCLALAAGQAVAAEIPEPVIQQSFHPYASWTPEHAGYSPGMTLNAQNVEQFKEIVDEALYFFLKMPT